MKQICGYCLKEFNGQFCPCNDSDKRTFFSDSDFSVDVIDKPICGCGLETWVYQGRKSMGNRQVINFKCECGTILGSETYNEHFTFNPNDDIKYDNLVQIKTYKGD